LKFSEIPENRKPDSIRQNINHKTAPWFTFGYGVTIPAPTFRTITGFHSLLGPISHIQGSFTSLDSLEFLHVFTSALTGMGCPPLTGKGPPPTVIPQATPPAHWTVYALWIFRNRTGSPEFSVGDGGNGPVASLSRTPTPYDRLPLRPPAGGPLHDDRPPIRSDPWWRVPTFIKRRFKRKFERDWDSFRWKTGDDPGSCPIR